MEQDAISPVRLADFRPLHQEGHKTYLTPEQGMGFTPRELQIIAHIVNPRKDSQDTLESTAEELVALGRKCAFGVEDGFQGIGTAHVVTELVWEYAALNFRHPVALVEYAEICSRYKKEMGSQILPLLEEAAEKGSARAHFYIGLNSSSLQDNINHYEIFLIKRTLEDDAHDIFVLMAYEKLSQYYLEDDNLEKALEHAKTYLETGPSMRGFESRVLSELARRLLAEEESDEGYRLILEYFKRFESYHEEARKEAIQALKVLKAEAPVVVERILGEPGSGKKYQDIIALYEEPAVNAIWREVAYDLQVRAAATKAFIRRTEEGDQVTYEIPPASPHHEMYLLAKELFEKHDSDRTYRLLLDDLRNFGRPGTPEEENERALALRALAKNPVVQSILTEERSQRTYADIIAFYQEMESQTDTPDVKDNGPATPAP